MAAYFITAGTHGPNARDEKEDRPREEVDASRAADLQTSICRRDTGTLSELGPHRTLHGITELAG